ncbi:MAG TPA: hypothetical protein VG722_11635, partial [Tepidisphaeraceae bacterium]|nr:hypothetical protein [Tepidisphaeraceae bacterium]
FVTAPLKMQDDTTITVASADSALTISNLQSSTANITKSGPGTLMINAIAANGLSVDAGTVRILGDSGMSEVNNLNVGASAILDLTDNSLAVDYVGNSPFQTLDQDVANGYDGGKWDLSGIVSSTAAGNFPYSVGIRDTGQQVLIRYTLIGDANLDGWVNEADWAMIESDGNVWSEGDFNYDGKVNADDMGLFLLGLAESKALGHSVPEPNELAIMLIAIGCLPVRISRRNKSAARHYRRYPSHRIRT